MLTMLAVQMILHIVGLAIQVVFLATAAYWIAKMGRKGWNAGK